MANAICTVTINSGSVNCNPDPVPVSRATQDGIQWTFAAAGYTFTGIDITNNPGDFGAPVITTNPAGRSVMTVSDSVATLGDFKYTLRYTDPSGTARSYDPTIRNNP